MHTDCGEDIQPPASTPDHATRIDIGGISCAMASVIMPEERDKENRKLNVILHNVPEPTAEDDQIRRKEDIIHVNSIFHKDLGVSVTFKCCTFGSEVFQSTFT